MKAPEFGDVFPLDEYEVRISRLRSVMQQRNVDALLLSTEPNVAYTTGFYNSYWICQQFGDTQMVFLPSDPSREPVLLLPGHLMQAAQTSCVTAIQTWSSAESAVELVTATIRDHRLERGCIGVEIGPHSRLGMPLPFLDALRAHLPQVVWTDSSDVLSEVQRIKSVLEVEKVRTACRITCEAFEVGLNAIQVGMSEKELSRIILGEMVSRSEDLKPSLPWFLSIFATGRGVAAYDGVPTEYRFREGDCVYIDGGYICDGYHADMIRCCSIGKPAPAMQAYYDANRRANMDTIARLKPGLTGRECYGIFAQRAEELGYAEQIAERHRHGRRFLGHGLGLHVHEAPDLDGGSDAVLEPGMVFAVEGNIFHRNSGHTLKNEENVVITADGAEWLTPLDNDLWISRR